MSKKPVFIRLPERENEGDITISRESGKIPFYRSTRQRKNGQEVIGLLTRFFSATTCLSAVDLVRFQYFLIGFFH